MSFILLYVTVRNQQEAITIAKDLLADKLVACANISSPVISLYEWDGALQQEEEVILIAKTTTSREAEARARIEALHSYSCPCILTLPVQTINEDFASWIKNGTK